MFRIGTFVLTLLLVNDNNDHYGVCVFSGIVARNKKRRRLVSSSKADRQILEEHLAILFLWFFNQNPNDSSLFVFLEYHVTQIVSTST